MRSDECAWQESNLRPCAPEAHALSPELQARKRQCSPPLKQPASPLTSRVGEGSDESLGAKRRLSSATPEATLYPLSYRRGTISVAGVEVMARIATLELAETFVISRESSDTAEVVFVEVQHG